jgi:tRNA pseudouridine38-40 synthase
MRQMFRVSALIIFVSLLNMGRFKLTIEYDGSRYDGWQIQKNGRTVQGEVMGACRNLFGDGFSDLFGAGRTDSGVHATGQVAHLEAETDMLPLRIKYGINDRLPQDISIVNVAIAHPGFHARKDARARSYVYQISRRRTAFGKKYVWWIKDQLDIDLMNRAAKALRGFKDFCSFTDNSEEQPSTKVELIHCAVYDFDDLLLIHTVASHFLHKQVRRMAGVIVEAGRGKLNSGDIAGFFRTKSDVPAKLTAPPSGLFLEKVYYRNEDITFSTQPVINL